VPGAEAVRRGPNGPCRPALLLAAVALGCAHPRSPVPDAGGVGVGWTPAACARAEADADHDGADDRCELALASAFAPELRVDPRDCLWDAATGRLAGGYLFVAQPVLGGTGRVRLAYLPAYYRDCGWSGAVCRIRGPGCGAHAGDSELIAVDVEPATGGRWRTTGVFLSAHCFGRAGGRCRWYRGAELGAFQWVARQSHGAPVVWVARGKHAHYPSRGSCDRGHWAFDSCDGANAAVRFPVRGSEQNAGSRAYPAPAAGGCVVAARLPLGSAGTAPGARECVWDAARPFRGWQADARGTAPSPYARYLAAF
jgi:hypothetical protein